jgi:hypothetical protein
MFRFASLILKPQKAHMRVCGRRGRPLDVKHFLHVARVELEILVLWNPASSRALKEEKQEGRKEGRKRKEGKEGKERNKEKRKARKEGRKQIRKETRGNRSLPLRRCRPFRRACGVHGRPTSESSTQQARTTLPSLPWLVGGRQGEREGGW